MTWNPTTHPYRITTYVKTNQYGCFGWKTGPTQTFQTLDEAEDHAKELTTPVKGRISYLFEVNIGKAMNPETWNKNGYWKSIKLFKRKIKNRRWTPWQVTT